MLQKCTGKKIKNERFALSVKISFKSTALVSTPPQHLVDISCVAARLILCYVHVSVNVLLQYATVSSKEFQMPVDAVFLC